jgi:hypothetical protein
LLLLVGCSAQIGGRLGGDAGEADGAALELDAGTAGLDAAGSTDATDLDGSGGYPDAAPIDAASGPDAGFADASTSGDARPSDSGMGPADSGMVLSPSIQPGVGITFAEGVMQIGETFSAVTAQFGAPARRTPGMGARSYEYNLSGGAGVTVWFANTQLRQGDGVPPADVDPTDRVLWIAVGGSFTGKTTTGFGLGSTQGQAHGLFGVAPHPVPITSPPGALDAYYTRGIMIAYDASQIARTITVCTAYLHEPDGQIDPAQSELVFGGSAIQGSILGGTSQGDVEALFGPADASGTVNLGVSIDVAAYSFIGLEVYYLGGSVLFMSVHQPYYGQAVQQGGLSARLGDTRASFEAYLAAAGFGAAQTSNITGVVCYMTGGAAPAVGATYSTDVPPVVSSIVVAHPASACH